MQTKLLFFIFFTVYSSYVSAQKIRIVTEILPPFQMLDNNQQPTGVMVDIVNALLEDTGIQASIEFYPWARSYKIAKNTSNTLIFSMLRNKQRENHFQWIGKLYTGKYQLVGLKTNTNININSLEDAKKYSVGTIRNDLAESYFVKKGFVINDNLFLTATPDALWRLLDSGRIDVVHTNNAIRPYNMESLGISPQDLDVKYTHTEFTEEMYIAANKDTNNKIIIKLSHAIKEIKRDGRYRDILDKWKIK